MKSFNNVVRDIRKSIAQVLLVPLLLDGIVVFLALSILTAFFSWSFWYALMPAIAYTVFLFAREMGINKIKLVEKYYPHLQEKLITAADYADVDDAMVDELHREVLQEVKEVSTSAFLDRGKLVTKSLLAVLLCFALISLTQFNDETILVKNKIKDGIGDITARIIDQQEDKAIYLQEENGSGGGAGSGFNADIFGDASLAMLGDEELEVEIKPTTLELQIGTVTEAEKKEFTDVFPQEAFLETSQAYEENIPKEQQEIVKRYFKKVAESGS